ncbi:hypothetical protein NFI95_02095 [Acetobacteraceae bacterium KSS8]|uniref:Uncharacterized protein n=1 Tax=Endosaccharibacter trunci TaxID=2812733 RepID=A0ABT1W2Z5_9PROT|nr:hypothetical protein [Acetobacteraceae bacterium KSS8]
MTGRSILTRRGLLAAVPGAAILLSTGRAGAQVLSGLAMGEAPPTLGRPALLVAGAADTAPGRWAQLLAPRLASAFAIGSPLLVSTTGGRDGVTGANTFDAQTAPDGSTALLVPGAAAMAWLAGDPRVHFDAGRWVPALASLSSGILMGRDSALDLRKRTVRVAASTATGPELPALLGLSMLGAAVQPVFGLSEPQDAVAALASDRVDAVFLSGPDVPARRDTLAAAGFGAFFSLEDGAGTEFVPVQSFADRYRAQFDVPPSGSLFDAFQATSAAARLDIALVLPMLSPPSLVARWRSACETVVGDLGLVAAARKAEVDTVSAPECVEVMARINANETTQLSLRRWLAAQPGWQRV